MKNLKDPREEALIEMIGTAPTEKDRLPKGAGSENLMDGQDDAQEEAPEQGREAIEDAIDGLIENGVSVVEILARLAAENRIGDGPK